jgi:peptide/nickel transport system permease protein
LSKLGYLLKRILGFREQVAAQVVVKEEEKKERSLSGYAFYLKFLAEDKPALVGLGIIALFLIWALIEGLMQIAGYYTRDRALGWILLPSNPLQLNFPQSLLPPSLSHFPNNILGTDFNGESILARLLYAAPRDALAAILVVSSGIIFGMLLGTSAGYLGGWVDELIMRITDAFLALPALILAITLSVLLGSGYTSALLALVIIWWPTYTRFFRGQTLALKSRGFIEAAKLSRVGTFKILVRHIFPNAVDPILAYAALDIGNVILTYSTLAFLSIGVQPPLPEWGAMSSDGLQYFPQDWWWAIFPGLVIMIVVIAFTLVGDRMQDLIGGRATY